MRRFNLMVLIGLIAFAVILSISAMPAQAQQKKVVIGSSMVQKDSDWWAVMGRFVEQAANAEGFEVITLWAGGDQEKQIKDMEDLIQRKVNAIVMGPVQQDGSMVAINSAAEAGIPVITVGRRSKTDKQYAEVFADEPQFGVEQVTQISKDFPNGGNVVYLFGPVGAGYAIQMWEQGVVPTLEKHPNLKILQKYSSPSDIASDGMKNAEDAIVRYDNIDLIACSNDGLALGAVRAVQAAGKSGKITVYGAGATEMGMQAIADGEMRYTTIKSQAKMAQLVMQKVVLAVNGKPVGKKINLVEPLVVTKDNVLTVRDAMFGGTVTDPETFKPKK